MNSLCYITGFGAANKYDYEPIKQIKEGKVAIKHDKICIKTLSLSVYDSETMMCAGRARGKFLRSKQFFKVFQKENWKNVFLLAG